MMAIATIIARLTTRAATEIDNRRMAAPRFARAIMISTPSRSSIGDLTRCSTDSATGTSSAAPNTTARAAANPYTGSPETAGCIAKSPAAPNRMSADTT